ncbi:cytochrome P450 [Trujillonella endophytica]|uniref:Cytochrome P450 n=1 Tax=Trujillonella endophytica TaxID=673521 RepID=A0A1H8VWW8_9ACTN|nr:cytochrome P450 [Trujillella endophytica]SEP19814.1 Cytochrome P450 [Trujillella endophytica]
MTATMAGTDRVEIDFSVYNPFTPEFSTDPWPVLDRLLREYPVAYHRDMGMWFVTSHEHAQEVLRSPRFSTRMTDWNNAPASTPESEWTLYEKVQQHSMLNVSPAEHQRLRRLTAPAFSRRVMDQIEARIRDNIGEVFDELPDQTAFDAATGIADKIPIRAIARMVGVPAEAESLFVHGLGWNAVRATNPMYAADRDTYIQGTIPGLEYLFESVAEHRAAAEAGRGSDDFIGTLVATEVDGQRLSDAEIVSVVIAVVVAGADTAVDLHTLALQAFLTHPDQWALLGERPELMEDAILEVLRWGAHGKFGGIPRFPLEDVELGGQVMEKGSFVMPLFATAFIDGRKWAEPRRFDITRSHAGNLVFGAGPHLCIGLNLVKVQGKLMLDEFRRRFGDTARIDGEVEYDSGHWNARRITRLPIRTGA